MSAIIRIHDTTVPPGQRLAIDVPVTSLSTHTPVTMPVHVIRGRKPGPCLFVSAAIHGDEINGVEIIRRLLIHPALKRLHGTLLAVPIVNVFGFLAQSRYLPDGRDLNRCFPGSPKGSLAARLANIFLEQIVNQASHGIDLHTGARHRANLPQVRADLDDGQTEALARVFGVPVLLNADTRDGSLRAVAAERGMPMLLYEAGEALRFDEFSIRVGVRGILEVMRALEMLPASRRRRPPATPYVARSSAWVRAPVSGILRTVVPLGARVRRDEVLGIITAPLGEQKAEVRAAGDGIIIGRQNLPVINEGDALFNLARFEAADTEPVAAQVEAFHTAAGDPFDESPPEPPIV